MRRFCKRGNDGGRAIKKQALNAIRWLLPRRVAPSPSPPPAKPDPKDYSTIVGKGLVVPCQVEAYFLALNAYVEEESHMLDVGFGLGYGLNILATKARRVCGGDVDPKVLAYCNNTVRGRHPRRAADAAQSKWVTPC